MLYIMRLLVQDWCRPIKLLSQAGDDQMCTGKREHPGICLRGWQYQGVGCGCTTRCKPTAQPGGAHARGVQRPPTLRSGGQVHPWLPPRALKVSLTSRGCKLPAWVPKQSCGCCYMAARDASASSCLRVTGCRDITTGHLSTEGILPPDGTLVNPHLYTPCSSPQAAS